MSIGTGVGRTQKETTVVVGLSATDSSNRVVYKFALGFNLNFGNTKKMDEKMPIIDKLKDENEKFEEKLYVVDQFINDKYIPTK